MSAQPKAIARARRPYDTLVRSSTSGFGRRWQSIVHAFAWVPAAHAVPPTVLGGRRSRRDVDGPAVAVTTRRRDTA
jgi:hypothetical protein